MTEETDVTVTTNNHARPLYFYWDLTEEQKADVRSEYDWLFKEDSRHSHLEVEFFIFRGDVHCVCDFMRPDAYAPEWMKEWDGYRNDTYFSGLVIRYPTNDWGELDTESIVVGSYCAC